MVSGEMLNRSKSLAIIALLALVFLVSLHHGMKTDRNALKQLRKSNSKQESSEDVVQRKKKDITVNLMNKAKPEDCEDCMKKTRESNRTARSSPSLNIRTSSGSAKDGRCLGIFVDDCAEVPGQCNQHYTTVTNASDHEVFTQCSGAPGMLSEGGCQDGNACTGRAIRCSWECMGLADQAVVFPSVEFFPWYVAGGNDNDVCMHRANVECAKLLPAAVHAQEDHTHSRNPAMSDCTPKLLLRGARDDETKVANTGCSASLMKDLPVEKRYQNPLTHVKVTERMRAASQGELQEQLR